MAENTKSTPKSTSRSKTKTKSKTKKIRLKSDALFKSIMTEPAAARELLEEYLPPEVKRLLDLGTIKVEPESYVEDDLKNSSQGGEVAIVKELCHLIGS